MLSCYKVLIVFAYLTLILTGTIVDIWYKSVIPLPIHEQESMEEDSSIIGRQILVAVYIYFTAEGKIIFK
jgi:hypothetical protein